MLQELERMGYSWKRAKPMAKNHVHQRKLVVALYCPEVIKDNDYEMSTCITNSFDFF